MKIDRIGRRMFLQGAGAATLSIPFLGSLVGQAGAVPRAPLLKRAIFLALPYGTWRGGWFPSEASRTALSEVSPRAQSMPLSAFSGDLSPVFQRDAFGDLFDKMIMLDGIDGPYSSGHEKTFSLTGHRVESPSELDAPSIDQIIAERANIYDAAPTFRSVNVATGTGTHAGESISYADVGGQIQSVPQLADSTAVWDSAFSHVIGGDDDAARAEAERRRQLRVSVIDGVLSDYESLRSNSRLSANDKRRLDGYLDYLRDYEQSVGDSETVVCAAPPRPDSSGYPRSQEQAAALGGPDMVANIIHMVRCGLTNVLTYNVEPSSREYGFLPGVVQDHHPLSHGIEGLGSIATAGPQIEEVDRFHMRLIAQLVRGLDVEDPETGRSFLDDTIVYVGNDMGSVLNHKGGRMPLLMFGGGSALDTGRLVDFRSDKSWTYTNGLDRSERIGVAYNNVLITLCQLFGLEPEDYEYGQEGIGEYAASKYFFREFPGGNSDEGRANYEDFAYGDKRTWLSELLS